jgi:hypothetical protein
MGPKSWRKINVRVRIYTVLTALVVITLAGGLIMVWYTYRMENLLSDLVDKNLAAYQAAEALESALVHQKGTSTPIERFSKSGSMKPALSRLLNPKNKSFIESSQSISAT